MTKRQVQFDRNGILVQDPIGALSSHRSPPGFAQVLALVGLATVGGLLSLALVQSHQVTVSMALLDRQIVADTLAGSGLRRLLAAINSPSDDLDARVGVRGNPLATSVAGGEVVLAIEGEAGKIDVVAAHPEILARYVGQSGLPSPDRDALMATLLEARSARNGPVAFEALYLYLSPLGRSSEIERDFTMRSGLAGVDPALANERVLRAMPDLAEPAIATILRLRETDPSAVVGASGYFMTGRPFFTIVATVQLGVNAELTKRVPIEITTGGRAIVLSGFR